MQAVIVIFWVSFVGLVYTYIGYPIILNCINLCKQYFNKKNAHTINLPSTITIVIAAYNEVDFILQKITNLKQLELPTNTQIICITDGSTDGTNTLVTQNFTDVLVLHLPMRNGKAAAVNRAMPYCQGEIIFYSDANTWINPYGITKMLKHFCNPKVGAVAGEKRIVLGKINDVALHGESLYWRYEAWIKKNESNTNTVIGAAGELFAIRKNLFVPIPQNFINEDFVLSVGIAQAGYLVKYEPDAYAMEYPSASINDEMKRKVRIASGSFQLIVKFKNLFNIFKYGLLSWQFISRKIFRWAVCPLLLFIIFVANVFIINLHHFYLFIFGVQVSFYLLSVVGYFIAKKGKNVTLFISPFYFVFMHLCQVLGFIQFVKGVQHTNWQKVKRVGLG